MKFYNEKKEQYTLLRPDGEKLEAASGQELKAELVLLDAEGVRNIILDASKLHFADEKGLRSLVLGSALCSEKGGMFVLAAPTGSLQSCLNGYGLPHKIEIVPTIQEAVDAIFFHEIESELNSGPDFEE